MLQKNGEMAAEGEYLELRSRRRSLSRCAVAKAERAWTIHGHGKLTVRVRGQLGWWRARWRSWELSSSIAGCRCLGPYSIADHQIQWIRTRRHQIRWPWDPRSSHQRRPTGRWSSGMKSDEMVEADGEHYGHGERRPVCGLMILFTVIDKSASARIPLQYFT